MNKRLLLSAVLAAVLYSANAQSSPSVKNEVSSQIPDEVIFNSYSIRLQKLPGGGYLYDIFSGKQAIVHQNKNPFTGLPTGLKNREDALKIAKWQIVHINPVTKQLMLDKQLLPPEVAQQLQIQSN